MKKIRFVFFCILILVNTILYADLLSTDELAKIHQEGVERFKDEERLFSNIKNNILSSADISAKEKEDMIFMLREDLMSKSRRIHAEYRQPFIDAVLKEVESDMPEGGRISQSLGSDIYLKDASGSYRVDANGDRILNSSHRGMMGDLDLGGNPDGIKKLDEVLNKYGISQTTQKVSIPNSNVAQMPGYADFKDIEITVNNEGDQLYNNMVHEDGTVSKSKIKASAHETQMYKAKLSPDGTLISAKEKIKLDAFSKETYVSVSMAENQAGKKLVETNDHIKKASKGLKASPQELLSSKGEDIFQGMNKGTLKAIDSAGVSDTQLDEIIKNQKLEMSVEEFKSKLKYSKEGHVAQGLGILDEQKMQKYQKVCSDITKTAHTNASTVASIEIAEIDNKIADLDELAKSAPDGAQKEAYERQAKMWREQQADSKLKIDATSQASGMKANSSVNKLQTVLDNGQKVLSAYGNISDGLEIYDTYSKIQSGKISQNEGAATIAAKAVDIGANIAIDSATSAATGAAATTMGSIATVGAPMIVTAVSVHYVSEATKEGLNMLAAFKNEEILNKIADAKMQEVANNFMSKAEESLKKGIKSGDMDDFMDAEELSWKLYDLYERTGDTALLDASNTIDKRSQTVQKFLEKKHGVSMFELEDKIKNYEEKVVEVKEIVEKIDEEVVKEEEGVFFDEDTQDSDLNSEMAFMQQLDNEKIMQERADDIAVNSELSAYQRNQSIARAELAEGMQQLQMGLIATKQAMDAQNSRYNQQIQANNNNYQRVVSQPMPTSVPNQVNRTNTVDNRKKNYDNFLKQNANLDTKKTLKPYIDYKYYEYSRCHFTASIGQPYGQCTVLIGRGGEYVTPEIASKLKSKNCGEPRNRSLFDSKQKEKEAYDRAVRNIQKEYQHDMSVARKMNSMSGGATSSNADYVQKKRDISLHNAKADYHSRAYEQLDRYCR